MSLLTRLFSRKSLPESVEPLTGEIPSGSSERGLRTTPEDYIKYLYRIMWVDPDLRRAVLEIRDMDRRDGRVKKIHSRMARSAIKGGIQLSTSSQNTRIIQAFRDFTRRTGLQNPQKLESDAAALVKEGNLMLQVVLDASTRVAQLIRMPSETFLPKVAPNGIFADPRAAWEQYDLSTGGKVASFALWEIVWARLTPDNYDDMGSRGRPYLDAARSVWKQLRMTEEDLVIRRRTRAPLRMAHVLEGANEEQLDNYRHQVEADNDKVTTDYYLNRKGGVTALQGDANLDQIADVSYLLDTFFAGAPAPKGLFGYADQLNRDILEDLKRDYYEEIDCLQDIQAHAYEQAFRFDLLLQGINPDDVDFYIEFCERRTDTPNQRADLALKYQAMGLPRELVWKSAGLNPAEVRDEMEAEQNDATPYPDPHTADIPRIAPRVSITPGNSPKGESMTSISNR